jgi:hypothetical protein
MERVRGLIDSINGGFAGTSEAADGTRTHDLLHGKQSLNRVFPLSKRIRGVGDSRGLPAITVDSGNELVMARCALNERRTSNP